MKKKLFAILMSAVMMVSFMPAMAFASEEVNKEAETTAPTALDLTYNGDYQVLVAPGTFTAGTGIYDDSVVVYRQYADSQLFPIPSPSVTVNSGA